MGKQCEEEEDVREGGRYRRRTFEEDV